MPRAQRENPAPVRAAPDIMAARVPTRMRHRPRRAPPSPPTASPMLMGAVAAARLQSLAALATGNKWAFSLLGVAFLVCGYFTYL